MWLGELEPKKNTLVQGERELTNAEYFRQQAAKCLYLSRQCFDLNVAERLRLMAADFIAKAEEIEATGFVPAALAPARHSSR